MRERFSAGALQNARQSSWPQVLDGLWEPKGRRDEVPEAYRRIRGGSTTGFVSLEVA